MLRRHLLVLLVLVAGVTCLPATAHGWGPPDTAPPAGLLDNSVPRLRLLDDSVPAAGWFHVGGFTMPTGTAFIRYRNVARDLQTGVAEHGAGALSFWFRAPGAPGTIVTVAMQGLNGMGGVIADLGSITVTTGDQMLPLPENSGSGRRMVVDSDAQQVWLVEADGHVTDTFLMSGRRTRTASGSDQHGVFRVYSRSRSMRYCDVRCGRASFMVRYQRTSRSAVGTHGLPFERGGAVQGVEDLGWPLSHGCSRLADPKAEEVYRWATLGTVVIVF